MKWFRRILVAVVTLLVVIGVVAGVAWWKYRTRPAWYQPKKWSGEERAQLAGRAQESLAQIYSWANNPRVYNAGELAPATGPRQVAGRPDTTITIKDDEINALLSTWLSPEQAGETGFAAKVNAHFTDPQVHLIDGRMILAGYAKSLGRVLSLEFTPTPNKQGRLELQLTAIRAGEMPLPQWAIRRQLDRLSHGLSTELPPVQHAAAIDPSGLGNADAGEALGFKTLAMILQGQSVEPFAFLPIDQKARVAVRVREMEISEGKMKLTFEALGAKERTKLLKFIKTPVDPDAEVAVKLTE